MPLFNGIFGNLAYICIYIYFFLVCLIAYLEMWYRNVPKFSDRQVLANSADPDQTAPRALHCISVCIVWTHFAMVEPHSSNFRVITTNFLGVWIFRKFTVYQVMAFAICGQLYAWFSDSSVRKHKGSAWKVAVHNFRRNDFWKKFSSYLFYCRNEIYFSGLYRCVNCGESFTE